MKKILALILAIYTMSGCFLTTANAYMYSKDGTDKLVPKYDSSVQDIVITPEDKHGMTVSGNSKNVVTEGVFAGKSAFKVTLPDSAADSDWYGWVDLKNINISMNDYNYIKYEYYIENLDGADTDSSFKSKKPYAQLVTVSGSNVWKNCTPQGEYSITVEQMAQKHWQTMVIPITDDGTLDGKKIESICLYLLGVMAWHKNAEVYVTNITFSSHNSNDSIFNIGVQQRINSQKTKQDIRLISSVSDISFEEYKSYGVKIDTEVNGNKSCSNVKCYSLYTSLLAGEATLTPDAYEGKYFGFYTLSDVEIGQRTKYSITFYLETNDEKILWGDTFVFMVESDGSINTKVVENVTEVLASNKYITGTTEKNSVSYKIDEEIVFNLSLQADGKVVGCDKFAWTLTADDGSKITGTENGNTGELTVRTTLSKPGFVYLQVNACDKNGNVISGVKQYNGGAGVDIGNITKTTAEPDDFDEFWSQQITKLDGVTPELISCVEMNNSSSNFHIYAIKVKFYEGTYGNYVSGYLTVPKAAKQGSLKIRMWYNGHGVEDPVPYCNENTALFNVCAHSIEIAQPSSYYSELRAGKLNGYGFDKEDNSDPETVYFKEMVLRDVQALRFMKDYFGAQGTDARFAGLWDGENIQITGGSQGGFQAIAVAVLEDGATKVDAYCPWLSDIGGQGVDGKQKSGFMPEYTSALEYFDSINFAKRIRCDIIII